MNIKRFIPIAFIFLITIISITNLSNKKDGKNPKSFLIENEEETGDDTSNTYDLKKIPKFNCTDAEIDCSGNGKCSEDATKCECYTGYQTYYEDYEDYLVTKPRCNYKSKEQIKALLFSLFLSFGSAHFYLGHSLIGIIQLLFFVFIFIFNTTFIIKLSIKHIRKLNRAQVKLSFNLIIIMIILSVLFLFWYLFDLIMIYLNVYRDSKNAKMFSFLK